MITIHIRPIDQQVRSLLHCLIHRFIVESLQRFIVARIVASDIAYAVPLTLVAGLGHASMGSVDWSLLSWLLAGSLPGIWIGSRLVHKAPERFIRSVLSVLLAWAGSKLVFA